MTLHLAPNLKHPLYLGIDFWQLFKIQPHVLEEIETDLINDPLQHALSISEHSELRKIVKLFPNSEVLGLGQTHLTKHTIDVGNALPIKQRYYSVSPAVQQYMYAELDRMLALGVIEESDSSWSSPVFLVRKPGKIRLCLDARKVNQSTVKDAYPLPLI